MQRLLPTTLLYGILAAFIFGWWSFAFRTAESPSLFCKRMDAQNLALQTSHLLKELSPFQREAVQNALSGHFPKMLEFIDNWDKDAKMLASQGISHIQRLSPDQFLQAHAIGKLLQDSNPDSLRQLNCKMNLDSIEDDSGKTVQIEDSFERFLPQTFVAASFLLAIAQPHEIIALPKGMRHLPQLYQSSKLSLIPENIDRTHSEKLYLSDPHLAFVAPYSHPPALEVLRNQHIKLYTIKYVDTIAEIQEALLKVGHASNHILEAQLLALFIEAALLTIDNRLQALFETRDIPETPLRMLYLYYHHHFMLPTSKCLTGQLMTRAVAHCPQMSCPIPQSETDWRIPFEQEKILQSEPDLLLISTPNSQEIAHSYASLQQLKAFKSNKIFYLDEAVQESPTQHLVLAYYDIYQALAAAYCL